MSLKIPARISNNIRKANLNSKADKNKGKASSKNTKLMTAHVDLIEKRKATGVVPEKPATGRHTKDGEAIRCDCVCANCGGPDDYCECYCDHCVC